MVLLRFYNSSIMHSVGKKIIIKIKLKNRLVMVTEVLRSGDPGGDIEEYSSGVVGDRRWGTGLVLGTPQI